ncbi:50S ribosomal protein L10 [bacterium]|nr:50S ribosomal protein L10 [bacterium]
MPFTKEQKQKILENLKEKIDKQKGMIFVNFKGLKVKDMTDLRKKLKSINSQLLVVKKTLTRIAFEDKKIKINEEKLEGQIAIIFAFQDILPTAKTVYQFSQENENLKILAGYFDNEFREAEDVISLAKIPPREVLLAKLIGSIKAPAVNFVNVLQGNIKGLLYLLKAIKPNA